jgi:hypothetical protein
MTIDPNDFWRENYYNNPLLTDEMVATAEQRLGIRLPGAYLALLRVQNGGYTRRFELPMAWPTSWAPDCIPLFEMSGIGSPDEPTAVHNIYNRDYMAQEWGLPDNQILLSGDGHWWITLDYRRSPDPSVTWIDVEVRQDVVAARTFADFLEHLRPERNSAP